MAKAQESLQGALSEAANDRYNNAANRAYYAAYQAAVAALIAAGLNQREWYHQAVMATFAGELIRRRKLYHADLRRTLYNLYDIRVTADYSVDDVGRRQCEHALRQAAQMVSSIARRLA